MFFGQCKKKKKKLHLLLLATASATTPTVLNKNDRSISYQEIA